MEVIHEVRMNPEENQSSRSPLSRTTCSGADADREQTQAGQSTLMPVPASPPSSTADPPPGAMSE